MDADIYCRSLVVQCFKFLICNFRHGSSSWRKNGKDVVKQSNVDIFQKMK
jgi:hypothetical protein